MTPMKLIPRMEEALAKLGETLSSRRKTSKLSRGTGIYLLTKSFLLLGYRGIGLIHFRADRLSVDQVHRELIYLV